MRNFRLQQLEATLCGVAVGMGLQVDTVHPYTARIDLNLCSGDYNTNKEWSVAFVCDALGLSFWPERSHHVADTIMLAYWFLSKKEGLKIVKPSDAQSPDTHWTPPERWTQYKAPNRGRPSSSSDQKGGGTLIPTDGSFTCVKQVRKHDRQHNRSEGSGGAVGNAH